MVEEHRDLIEYKTKIARRMINAYSFRAGFAMGIATIMGTIILSISYFSSNPKLLGIVNMIKIESPEIITIWYIIEIVTILIFVIGIIWCYLADHCESKISKGDIN